jgi:hypothetical protein
VSLDLGPKCRMIRPPGRVAGARLPQELDTLFVLAHRRRSWCEIDPDRHEHLAFVEPTTAGTMRGYVAAARDRRRERL